VDFERALGEVGGFLDGRGAPWAVIGGLGLAALGFPRTTLDLDVVVPATVQDGLIQFLESEGFATLHRSPGSRVRTRGLVRERRFATGHARFRRPSAPRM
jgi:hypothetical protein